MKVGVGIPNGGLAPSVAELEAIARGAEDLGFDSVWTLDRWLRPIAPVSMPGVPVPVEMPAASYRVVFDPIDLLAFIAGRTSRIELGTSAINVLYHPPVLLARRLATVDHLCGGRLIAGVTSGWMREEFGVAGVSPTLVGEGFDEHLDAMRRIWGPDPVSFDGTWYQVPASDIGPKPVRGSIPLIVGYNTRAGIRRAARIGDGLHPYRGHLATLRDDLAIFHDAAVAAGRDPTTLPVVLRVHATTAASDDGDSLFTGAVTSWATDLDRVHELGVDHVVIQVDGDTSTTLRHLQALQRARNT